MKTTDDFFDLYAPLVMNTTRTKFKADLLAMLGEIFDEVERRACARHAETLHAVALREVRKELNCERKP